MQPRTRRQREILDFITEFIDERGHIPSYQQIARKFKIASKSAIAKHIAAMEKQGILKRRREDGSFGLELSQENSAVESVCEITWLETASAEDFRESWEQEPIFVPKFLLGYYEPEKIRAFRVPNSSMLDEHICEGDVAIIEKREFARDGDIVVSIINSDRVILKRIFRDGANVELRPSNEKYESIKISADKVEIKGIFRGLIRPL